MRASSGGLYVALHAFATTSRATAQFEAARAAEPILARFSGPAALIAYLETEVREDSIALDDKDALYATLVRGIQSRAAWSEIAHIIVGCSLRSKIFRAYKKRVRRMVGRRDELVATICAQLIQLTGSLDLMSVTRIAATLTQSTVREVVREQRRERREAWIGSGLPPPDPTSGGDMEVDTADSGRSARTRDTLLRAREALTIRPHTDDAGATLGSFEVEYAALRRRLLPALGEDTDLLLLVLVGRESKRWVADRLGIPHTTVRKRFERALPVARQLFVHFPLLKRS